MLKILSAIALALSLTAAGHAQGDDLSKTIDGITIYLGIVPAEIVRGHPSQHGESTMHRAVPRGSEFRHIVVALFDAKTGDRITDATVDARVEQVGLAAQNKALDPMQIASTLSYGNYFAMPPSQLYTITLKVKAKRYPHAVEARFEYRS